VINDWKEIEAQAKADLERIQTDADAYAFMDKYFSRELLHNYRVIYRSSRHEMLRTPRQAIDEILTLPPL